MIFLRLLIPLSVLALVGGAVVYVQRFKMGRLITRGILPPFVLLFVVVVGYCNTIVTDSATGKVYADVQVIPQREVGLVLGVNKVAAPPFFNYRVEAAAILYKSRKVKQLLVSGSKDRDGNDEAFDLKTALVAKGVPDAVIIVDNGGNRTLESVRRCKQVFGFNNVTVVSQAFHDVRAIFMGSELGMDIIGYEAQDAPGRKLRVREYLSRLKAVIELRIVKR